MVSLCVSELLKKREDGDDDCVVVFVWEGGLSNEDQFFLCFSLSVFPNFRVEHWTDKGRSAKEIWFRCTHWIIPYN